MRRIGLSVVVGLVVAVDALMAGPRLASADPVYGKNAGVLELERAGGITGTVEVVVNGNGQWTPGHILWSNQVLIPYGCECEATFTPGDGGPVETFSETTMENAPRNGRLAVCTFSETEVRPEGTFDFTGTVYASYTPARKGSEPLKIMKAGRSASGLSRARSHSLSPRDRTCPAYVRHSK